MGAGINVLIVGIAGTDEDDKLESIASFDELKRLFGGDFSDDKDATKFQDYVYSLEKDPLTEKPGLFYVEGNFLGATFGAGLGYVLFAGEINAPPIQVDERIFARIPELKDRFVRELASHGLNPGDYNVGLHAINVYDT